MKNHFGTSIKLTALLEESTMTLLIWFLLIMTLGITVLADVTVDVQIGNSTTTLTHDSQTLTLAHPISGSSTNTFTISTPSINSTSINYTIIEQFCKEKVNYTTIASLVNERVAEKFADQQSYLHQTFLPEIQKLEQLEQDVISRDFQIEKLTQTNDKLELSFQLYNRSEGARAVSCEEEQAQLLWILTLMLLMAVATVVFLILRKKKQFGTPVIKAMNEEKSGTAK